jgi:O-antigen/teichoic acid export membrane protein
MNLYILAFRLGAEPFFFNISDKKNAKQTYAQVMLYFVIIGVLALLGIVLFLDLFKHFINPNYWVALEIVPVVLLANLFLGMYHNLSIWYKLTDKTKYGMYFSIIGAVITVLFNVVFLQKIGYMASAYATLLAYGSMLLLSYFIGKKHYKIAYNTKRILTYLGMGILSSYVVYYKLKPTILQAVVILLAFALGVFFFEKKQIKKQL